MDITGNCLSSSTVTGVQVAGGAGQIKWRLKRAAYWGLSQESLLSDAAVKVRYEMQAEERALPVNRQEL